MLVVNVFMPFGDIQYEANIIAGVGISSLVFLLSRLLAGAVTRSGGTDQGVLCRSGYSGRSRGNLRWSGNALASYQIVGVLTAGIGIVVVLLGLVPSSHAGPCPDGRSRRRLPRSSDG